MATRKIKLTLSGSQIGGIGPIINVGFNGNSLDSDYEVTAISGTNTETREYTVDVEAGTHNLEIQFLNDEASDTEDRNLMVRKLEIANDGVNYNGVFINEDNSTNLVSPYEQFPSGRVRTDRIYGTEKQPNPNFDPSLPQTDDTDNGYVMGEPEGSNAKWMFEDHYVPHKIWTSTTATVQVEFT